MAVPGHATQLRMAVPGHATQPHMAVPGHATQLCHAVPCMAVLGHATQLCHAVPCMAVPGHATQPCTAAPCRAMHGCTRALDASVHSCAGPCAAARCCPGPCHAGPSRAAQPCASTPCIAGTVTALPCPALPCPAADLYGGPSGAEPCRAAPSPAERRRTLPSGAEPCRAAPNPAERRRALPSGAEPCRAALRSAIGRYLAAPSGNERCRVPPSSSEGCRAAPKSGSMSGGLAGPRAAVRGVRSRWRPVLFHIVIDDLEEGIRSVHPQFADDTGPGGSVYLLEGRKAPQRDLGRPRRRAEASGARFGRAEGHNSPTHWEERLEGCPVGKEPGMLVDSQLKMSRPLARVAKVASSILACVRNGAASGTREGIALLYSAPRTLSDVGPLTTRKSLRCWSVSKEAGDG
ncbi:uncharacterized protein [Haliaeetus albicilla]|uniref:uncharacterized protein n=1 Tax=Haliaeetus albicilla TaxID=8969 RepID=UPI0037E93C96